MGILDEEGRPVESTPPVGPNPFEDNPELPLAADELSSQLINDIRVEEFATPTKGVYQRETHDVDGSHIFLVYNDHTGGVADKAGNLLPEIIIQKYPPGHKNPNKKDEKIEFRWDSGKDIKTMFEGEQLAEVTKLISLLLQHREDSQ